MARGKASCEMEPTSLEELESCKHKGKTPEVTRVGGLLLLWSVICNASLKKYEIQVFRYSIGIIESKQKSRYARVLVHLMYKTPQSSVMLEHIKMNFLN